MNMDVVYADKLLRLTIWQSCSDKIIVNALTSQEAATYNFSKCVFKYNVKGDL
ncbi:hypothetical protein M2105_002303 [Paenibacillus sp. PastF-1]|nr:hypothetical protein [Paenibacillus sp. PastF-2]MDF9847878.1 hypothetical protein [Paenibacillus sp. PastM-2]MDF9854446.1 hypothetical protein [Paenibacillus sp. PastF-1]MDH6479945.1 hypothetical protein [Paenibacillus sp. PastH-2]MDH6507153.1 hypothetical protein [Paenibacillus sp. PastM-3]